MSRLLAAVIAVLISASMGLAQSSPLQRIERRLGPFLTPADPLGLALKVRALRQSPYKFWRGSKDLYFEWIKANRPDWLRDAAAFVIGHCDPHFGNLGTYATDSHGGLAFGPVDFDDAAPVPFQTELVQGLVTLRLVAEQHGLAWTDAFRDELAASIVDAYRSALLSDKLAVELMANDPWLQKLQERSDRPYAKELTKFVEANQFRSRIGKVGKPTDLLRPYAPGREVRMAVALSQAAARNAGLTAVLGTTDAGALWPRIKAVAVRTRVDSSGSQGLMKLLVLVAGQSPKSDDLLIYLKQQVPAAAERTGCVPFDPRSPGERSAAAVAAINDPPPVVNSWCDFDGRSFWVGLKEPWSDELDADSFTDADDLRHAAVVWGTTFGAAHRQATAAGRIVPRLSPLLIADLCRTADAFTDWQAGQYAAFLADPHTEALAASAERALRDAN